MHLSAEGGVWRAVQHKLYGPAVPLQLRDRRGARATATCQGGQHAAANANRSRDRAVRPRQTTTGGLLRGAPRKQHSQEERPRLVV